MNRNGKKTMITGAVLVILFVVWTVLITSVDVQPVGQNGTDVGFAAVNTRFHALTGVHMKAYKVTDWLGLVPILICAGFGVLGFIQLVRRKSLKKVDADIIMLGLYYIVVILAYLFFEMFPVNYRPVLIDGTLEASYPSSTTLLVLCVIPTLILQVNRRAENRTVRRIVTVGAVLFAAFMVAGRMVAGVHWLTDILGAVLLSAGLYLLYRGAVMTADERQ